MYILKKKKTQAVRRAVVRKAGFGCHVALANTVTRPSHRPVSALPERSPMPRCARGLSAALSPRSDNDIPSARRNRIVSHQVLAASTSTATRPPPGPCRPRPGKLSRKRYTRTHRTAPRANKSKRFHGKSIGVSGMLSAERWRSAASKCNRAREARAHSLACLLQCDVIRHPARSNPARTGAIPRRRAGQESAAATPHELPTSPDRR